jgi:Protein of unknown function (DUF1499)
MPLMRRNVTIRRSRAAGWARVTGGLALPVLALGVIGMRAGVVPQLALQPVLVAGFALGLSALALAVYALADIWVSGADGAGSAFVGILYAFPVLVILCLVAAAAIYYPRLSDISTDINDPPQFSDPGAAHPAPGADSIDRQLAAYPEINSRTYPLPFGDVFVAALGIMKSDHWTVTHEVRPAELPMAASRTNPAPVVAEDPELTQALAAKSVMTQSRGGIATQTLPTEEPSPAQSAPVDFAILEATAPTPIFGYIDDVVVRMRVAADGSTIVDMRSASRIGAHDLGQNARRIESFYTKLDAVLQPRPGADGSGVASASQ